MKREARKAAAGIPTAADAARPNGCPDRQRRKRHRDLARNFDHILMVSNGGLQQQERAGMAARPWLADVAVGRGCGHV
jgi:hypothetical protein